MGFSLKMILLLTGYTVLPSVPPKFSRWFFPPSFNTDIVRKIVMWLCRLQIKFEFHVIISLFDGVMAL